MFVTYGKNDVTKITQLNLKKLDKIFIIQDKSMVGLASERKKKRE